MRKDGDKANRWLLRKEAADFIMVEFDTIVVNKSDPSPLVILSNDERTLSIEVGEAEAEVIDAALENKSHGRPLTHDLIRNLLIGLRGNLQSITIYKFEANIFHAHLNVEQVSEEGLLEQVVRIDCRPSDGIAIALRTKSPIYVTEEVMVAADQEQDLRDNENVKGDDLED